MRRHAIVPDVATYSAAISVCEKGQQHPQALRFLRALQRHAIVPDVVTYGAVISVCEKGPAAPAGLTSPFVQCSVMPSCRRGLPTVLPGDRMPSLSCQQASHLLREMQHHDIVPDVITNYAAISACEKGLQCQQASYL